MIEIKMIAESTCNKVDYKNGEEYSVTEEVYQLIKQSCEIVKEKVVNDVDAGDILIVKSYGIGNIINMTPLIRKVSELYPQSKIDLLVSDGYEEVLEGWDIINRIYTPTDINQMKQRQKESYDLIIDGVYRSINTNNLGLLTHNYITGDPGELMKRHEVDVNMDILKQIGYKGVEKVNTYIPLTHTLLSLNKGDKFIAVCAGWAGADHWTLKNWGYKNYGDLVRLLRVEYPDKKILVMGTGNDRKVLDGLEGDENIIDCVSKLSLQESAYALSRAAFVVCNDTGLGHVASAAGCYTYSLFGCTSIVKNRPYNGGLVITKDLKCSPCQLKIDRGDICKDVKCMDMDPEYVMERVKKNEIKKVQELDKEVKTKKV